MSNVYMYNGTAFYMTQPPSLPPPKKKNKNKPFFVENFVMVNMGHIADCCLCAINNSALFSLFKLYSEQENIRFSGSILRFVPLSRMSSLPLFAGTPRYTGRGSRHSGLNRGSH